MSISGSDRRRAVWGGVLGVLGVFAAAVLFWWVQNNLRPVGGAIAFQKALWLAAALVLWIVLPIFILRDPHVDAGARRAFKALLILMALRAVVEGWMLYVTLNWSPRYGIAHDLACMAALAYCLARYAPSIQPLWRVHIALTTLAFIPEIYFAWYMKRHFSTQGQGAVYFVPDDPAHAVALNVTWATVVCFTAYIFVFLIRWLNAASDGGGAGAR